MFRIYQRLRWIYLSVFGAQVIPMSAIIIWREGETGGHTNFFDLLIASLLKIDDMCYLALATSVITVDIGRYLVGILIQAPQDRAYEEGFARGETQGEARGLARGETRGKAQGKAEERNRWLNYDRRMQDWHRRFLEHHERGETFDEPMPKPPSQDDA